MSKFLVVQSYINSNDEEISTNSHVDAKDAYLKVNKLLDCTILDEEIEEMGQNFDECSFKESELLTNLVDEVCWLIQKLD